MNPEKKYCVKVADCCGVFYEKTGLTFGGAVAVAVLKKFFYPAGSSYTIRVCNLDMCDYDSNGLTEDEQIIIDDALDKVKNDY